MGYWEQDFSKSAHSNLLKLGMIVHKWRVHIATEGFVCKMYILYVSKLLQLKKKKNELFFFASNINIIQPCIEKVFVKIQKNPSVALYIQILDTKEKQHFLDYAI